MDSQALAEGSPRLESSRRPFADVRISLAMVTAIVLVGTWLLLAPRSPDFAAQTYRATLFERFGFTVWDNNWYGGHHLPGYSLVFPWLALLLGIRLAGALAVLVSTFAFERIALGVYGPRGRWGAVCFALAAAGDLWIGRVTFALGVTFAVLAVLALVRERPWLAVVLTVLCTATSPVAGLLLALAGATHVFVSRRALAGLTLVLPVLVVVLPLEALFPEGGWEPFAASSIIATVAVTLAFLYAVPWEERLLRIGGLIYLGVIFLSIAPTPMGSNIARYAVILAGPLALCVLGRDGFSRPGRPLASIVFAVGLIVVWTVWGPVRESAEVVGDASTSAAYYVPLERFLDAHGGGLVRVEVPFTHSHWEAAYLAQHFSLARGWERQLDTKYDPLFFGGTLTASAYRAWLKNLAVSYVALPDVRLDGSSDEEGALIRKGLPYLREVFSSRHWRVFKVLDPMPIASAPAVLTGLDHDSFTLRFAAAGRSLVRLHYTRYWTFVHGQGCVSEAPGGWTAVRVKSPGVVRVLARFSLGRALGLAGSCG
ncbi:MAG TPA: hypothetical protein VHY18_13080 [Solirubrobacteraceae bacterium]|nr:hypothetical protein [Solirubrobacteraceae bacterium]